MTFVSYAQNFEDAVLHSIFKQVEHGFYVDVGARDPVMHSVTKVFYDRGWRGINIEPVSSWYERLVADRPNDINLQLLAGANRQNLAFFEILESGLSTADPTYAQRHKNAGFLVKEYSVSSLPLHEILDHYKIDQVHFLKIDVEGTETQVLEGMDFSAIRPWIVLVEATVPLSSELCFMSWEPLLLNRGYLFFYFDGLNRFYVAKERAELTKYFLESRGAFDQYVSYHEWNAFQNFFGKILYKLENVRVLRSLLHKTATMESLKNMIVRILEPYPRLKEQIKRLTFRSLAMRDCTHKESS